MFDCGQNHQNSELTMLIMSVKLLQPEGRIRHIYKKKPRFLFLFLYQDKKVDVVINNHSSSRPKSIVSRELVHLWSHAF